MTDPRGSQIGRGKLNIIILALCVCALAILACLLAYRYDNKYTAAGPRATKGLLCLDERALEQYPAIMLVDGWEIYNGKLLSPQDFDNNAINPDEYIYIGQYGGFDFGNVDTPPHGSATYRLNIEIPNNQRTYMLELPEIFSAYRLYVNGMEKASLGEPSPQSYRPAVGNRTISFEASNNIDIVFNVSDFTHFYSGMVFPPAFGTPAAVSSLLNARLIFRCALCSLVIVIGLLSLLIGLMSKRKMQGVLYACLCLFYSGYAGYTIIRTLINGYYPWYILENLSYNAMFATIMLLHTIVCEIKTRWRHFALWLGIVACLAAILMHATLPSGNLRIMLAYSTFLTVYVWFFALFITATSCRAVLKGTVHSMPLLCGALIFDCAMVMDRLLPLHEPIVTGWFHELAGFMLIVTIGIAIAKELATGYKESAVLREREDALEKMTGMQQSYFRVLDEKAAQINTSRHDLHHHYILIGEFIKGRRYDELETYLSENLSVINASAPKVYCSNSIINVLTNHYAGIAESNMIHFEARCDIDGDIEISDADLCSLLGNLFENAVDACRRFDAGQRFIRVGITAVGHLLTIRLRNSTGTDVRQRGNDFLSSKRESAPGLGLDSVKSIAERNGGEARFSWNKDEQIFESMITCKTG
ncbi:MAG: ATP-binding protein [Oscillospiraceae bacterium]|nr:ATP-binding protein [Oscillospiraceae bacterium]